MGGLATVWVWTRSDPDLREPGNPGNQTTAVATTAADPQPAQTSPALRQTPPDIPAVVVTLAPESRRDSAVPALVLEAPAGAVPRAYLFLALETFPLHGGLRAADAGELRLGVVNWSQQQGYVLLSLEQALPDGMEPAPARGSNSLGDDEMLRVPGTAEGLRVSGTRRGLLVLQTEVRGGAALLDDGGNAVALTLGGNLALPVDAAIAWLGQRQRSDLDELRRELRIGHPELAIEDATELLSQRRTLAEVRDALILLDQASALVQDRQALLQLDELRQTAAQILVQDLARVDGAAALVEARQQLSRHPNHPGLLADTLVLALNNGDALEALALYDQLLAMSPDHAREVTEDLTRGLSRLIRRMLVGRRYQEAIDLAAGAVSRFVQRADLRMLYANSLWQSGRQADAVEQGGLASQLDPAHREQVSSWQASLARARDPDTVILPYDPATNAIFTQVTIGGQVLELIIDTGASLTTIPAEFAQRLGLVKPDSQVIRIDTANGEILGRRVLLPNLTIGTIRLREVDAVVIDIPGLEGRGLLGLNVLQPLNMQIDSENKVLILRRPKGRRRQP